MKNIILTYGLVFFLAVLVCGGGLSLTVDTTNHAIEPGSPLTNALPYIVNEIDLQENEDNHDNARIQTLVDKGFNKISKIESSCNQANEKSFSDIALLKSVVIIT